MICQRLFLAGLLVVTGVLLLPVQVMAFQVELFAHATVSGEEILVQDVVRMDSALERFGQVRLGRAPSPGDTRELDRSFILRAMQRSGANVEHINWVGAEAVMVKRSGIAVSSVEIEGTINAYLDAQQQRFPNVDLEFKPYSPPGPFIVPTGKLSVEVIPAADNILNSRSITLLYRVDGRVVNNLTVRGEMHATAEVVVAINRIRRGNVISAADVDCIETEIGDVVEPIFSCKEVIGMELSRSVRAGEPVDRRYLQPPVVIERGAFVKIIAERGAMRLEATGTAIEDGRVGDVIRVQNSSSLKEIRAEVADKNEVRVRF